MSKFTPGEWVVKHWEVRDNQGALEGCGFQVMAVHDGDEQAIHTISLEGDPESAEADLHLISAAKDMLEALQGIEVLHAREGENSNETFERIAAVFHRETGFLRPGKDSCQHDDEERIAAWEAWVAAKKAAMRAAISKATAEKAQEN